MQQTKLGMLVAVAAIFLGVYFAGNSLTKPAPAFSLPDPYGGQIDLASYAGRPVLLVFWTTSCPICQRELPMLDRLEPEFRGKGISILTICIGGETEVQDYLGSNGINLKSAYDSDGAVARAYRVGGVPKLVLVGKDGKVKRSQSGWANEDELRDWMDAAS